MTSLPKRILYASIVLMVLVVAATIVDFVTGTLFAKNWMLDVMFLIASGVIIYLAIDALQEQK